MPVFICVPLFLLVFPVVNRATVSECVAFIFPVSTSIISISPILPSSPQTYYTDMEDPAWDWNQCCHHLQTIRADAQRWLFQGGRVGFSPEKGLLLWCRVFLLLFTCSVWLFCEQWTAQQHTVCAFSVSVASTAVNPPDLFCMAWNLIFSSDSAESLNTVDCLISFIKTDRLNKCVWELHHISGCMCRWLFYKHDHKSACLHYTFAKVTPANVMWNTSLQYIQW